MILIISILASIVVGIAFYKAFASDWDDGFERAFTVFISSFLGLCFAALGYLACTGLASLGNSYDVKYTAMAKVVTIQDNPGQQGNLDGGFFFLSGYVQGENRPALAISWYEKSKSGYAPRSVTDDACNNITIIEQPATTDPKVVQTDWKRVNETPWWVSPVDIDTDNDPWNCHPYQVEWDFYVPKGTIKGAYNLDAK